MQLVAAGKRQGYWTTVDSFSLVSDLGNSGSEATAKGSIHRLALGESDRAIPLQNVGRPSSRHHGDSCKDHIGGF